MAVSLSGARERLERFWLGPQPVHAMVIGRIVFGAILFLTYLWRLPDANAIFGPESITGEHWFRPFQMSPHVARVTGGLEAALPPFSDPIFLAIYVLTLISAVSFALGYKTRLSGFVLLALHMYLQRFRAPWAYWGWAAQMQPYLAYIVLSRAGAFYSVDAWLRRRRTGEPAPAETAWETPGWTVRLLQFHVSAMYLISGGERLDDPGWIDGQAIWYALTRVEYSRFPIDWTAFKPLLEVATWGTWLLEPIAAIGMWIPKIGVLLAYSLIAMHFGLELLNNIGWWSYIMVPGLLTFVPRAHLAALFARLPGGPARQG